MTRVPPWPLQVTITKEACTIVGDGSTAQDVEARVKQIRNLAADTEQVGMGAGDTVRQCAPSYSKHAGTIKIKVSMLRCAACLYAHRSTRRRS
jgi:hypothetical protein